MKRQNRNAMVAVTIIGVLAMIHLAACFVGILNAANSTPTPDATYGATWVLDTTGTITTDKVQIRTVYWTGCTTNNHTFILTDGDDNLIWKDLGGEAGIPHMFYLDRPVNGLKLTTLGSGTLTIDVRPVRW